MAATGTYWWMTPIQGLAAVTAGINFGASALQTPLTAPMFELPDVPALYAGRQLRWLLHHSEYIFPPLNMFGTVANLALATTCYLKRDANVAAGVKWPYLATALLCNAGTTAWALLIMVPRNNKMVELTQKLEADPSDEKSEKEWRERLKTWKVLNLGRASFMLSACLVGMYTLFLDGRYMAPISL